MTRREQATCFQSCHGTAIKLIVIAYFTLTIEPKDIACPFGKLR